MRYDTHILGPEHTFPRDVGPSRAPELEAELAGVRASVEALRSMLDGWRTNLLELQGQLGQLERHLSRLEMAQPAPARPHQDAAPDARELVATPVSSDIVVDRVDRLRATCEALLKRPLMASERPIVLRWSQLERSGEPVPVEEILQLAGRLLTRRTPDGTLPSSLAWCDATVQTLSRGAAGPVPPRGMDAAAEFAALYESLADRLDAQERTG